MRRAGSRIEKPERYAKADGSKSLARLWARSAVECVQLAAAYCSKLSVNT
ncbi:MAG: hypothetical protein JWO08_3156 [Verrucomicrobiaceae bacterium]|nr:hypothetical protein [Verrucomicrobiaceae bacterium]